MNSIISVIGITPVDKKDSETSKKIQICQLCNELRIEIPKELENFWRWTELTEEGDIIKVLPDEAITEVQLCGTRYIEVDLEKIPKEITKLRFEHSY